LSRDVLARTNHLWTRIASISRLMVYLTVNHVIIVIANSSYIAGQIGVSCNNYVNDL